MYLEVQQTYYAQEIEESLEVEDFIVKLEALFDEFVKSRKHPENEVRNEANVLGLIRCFFYKKKWEIKALREGTMLSNSDCITLSIMASLLAKRKGYEIKIAYPRVLHRSLHALLIQSDGTMFQIAGRYRNYVIRVLEPQEVVSRLKLIKPIFDVARILWISIESSR
jgi:hypothetical protein